MAGGNRRAVSQMYKRPSVPYGTEKETPRQRLLKNENPTATNQMTFDIATNMQMLLVRAGTHKMLLQIKNFCRSLE